MSRPSRLHRFPRRLRNSSGFTLMEILVAILIIGIAVPALLVPFSGINSVARPEFVAEATFLGQQQMEAIADQTFDSIPAAGGPYTCGATFPGSVDISAGPYTCEFMVENVAANDLVTPLGVPGFGKKVTLTIAGNGESLDFVTLF